jgi:DNA polymerase
MGSKAKVMRDRGKLLESSFAKYTVLTVHPSYLLRAPDEKSRRENYKLFVADLRVVAKVLENEE